MDLKKYIIIGATIFVVGFGGLFYYVLTYESKSEERKQSYVEQIIKEEEEEANKFVPSEKLEERQSGTRTIVGIPSLNNEYNEETGEWLIDESVVDESISELDEESFNQHVSAIQNLIINNQINEAGVYANNILADYLVPQGEMFATLFMYNELVYWDSLEYGDKYDRINWFTDPITYVRLFYTLPPEIQYKLLRERKDEILMLSTEENPFVFMGIYDKVVDKSNARLYFSNLGEMDIYKIVAEQGGVIYNIYWAYKEGYTPLITNVEVDEDISKGMTYDNYFTIWGYNEYQLGFM